MSEDPTDQTSSSKPTLPDQNTAQEQIGPYEKHDNPFGALAAAEAAAFLEVANTQWEQERKRITRQTHLISRTLKSTRKPDKNIQVLFSVTPRAKAVLFVHGFSGDAIKTWSDFSSLLPKYDTCAGYDLYFYGYNGLRAEMNASASIFRGFLDRLFTNTVDLVNGNLPKMAQRDITFSYEEIIIVGHSLGAVITRRALLDAIKLNNPWASRVKIVLYAPAHRGASVGKLALEAVSSIPFLKWFGGAVRFTSPLIDQLDPKSEDLKMLMDETVKACADGKNANLVAIKVMIAEFENIVKNRTFCNDPPPTPIPDTTHTSVCKPSYRCLEPLNHLESIL